MARTKLMIWSAALAVAIGTAMIWPRQAEESAPKPAAEPDLFSFVKPVADVPQQAAAQGVSAAPGIPAGGPTQGQPEPNDSLPPALREVPDATMKVSAVQETAQQMRSQGASEEEINRMRAAALSVDAANQLAGMEKDEAAWKNRVNSYLAEKDRLLNGAAYADADKQQALQQLRDSRFTQEEQKQLAAYEFPNIPQLKMD